MSDPNFFDYATSELSQDAVLIRSGSGPRGGIPGRGRTRCAAPTAAAALALVLALVLGTSGCDLLGPNQESFTVRVDSISAPAVIAPGEPLVMQFHGTVGPDGCHRLERVARMRTSDRLELRFHGERRTGFVDCTAMIVPLEHEEQVAPPLEDPFTILVRQPGGGTLEWVVRVE